MILHPAHACVHSFVCSNVSTPASSGAVRVEGNMQSLLSGNPQRCHQDQVFITRVSEKPVKCAIHANNGYSGPPMQPFRFKGKYFCQLIIYGNSSGICSSDILTDTFPPLYEKRYNACLKRACGVGEKSR